MSCAPSTSSNGNHQTSNLKVEYCVVMYPHISEIRLVEGGSNNAHDFTNLQQGSINDFVFKGYTRPAIVLGTGVTAQDAMKKAQHFLQMQHGDANDDDYESPILNYCTDPDTSDSDETVFDMDILPHDQIQKVQAPSITQQSLESMPHYDTSDSDETAFNTEISQDDENCHRELYPLTTQKSFDSGPDTEDSKEDSHSSISAASDHDSHESTLESTISDVDTFINGNLASHTLCGTSSSWRDVMDLFSCKTPYCSCSLKNESI